MNTAIRFLRYVAAGALLAAVLWPFAGFEKLYGPPFRAGSQMVFGPLTIGHKIDFKALDVTEQQKDDTLITLRRKQKGQVSRDYWRIGLRSRFTGFMPFGILLALVLMTPMSYQRRRKALLWGTLFVHLYVAARMSLVLLFAVAEFAKMTPERYPAFVSGDAWHGFLDKAVSIVHIEPSIYILTPVVIWVLVSLRPSDLPGRFGQPSSDHR